MGFSGNRSSRKLFSNSSLLSQSSELELSCANNSFQSVVADGNNTSEAAISSLSTAVDRGKAPPRHHHHQAVSFKSANPEASKLKNKLFTSTPIRSYRNEQQHFNQTFPVSQSRSSQEQQQNQQLQQQQRRNQNRTITLADFMRIPDSQFPTLNAGAVGRKKATSSSNHVGTSNMRASAVSADCQQQHQHVTSANNQGKQKHKRRVVPISILPRSSCASTSDFANAEFQSSPFRAGNNLMEIQGEEREFGANSLLQHERKMLKSEKELIKIDFDFEEQGRNDSSGNLRKIVKNLLASGGEAVGGSCDENKRTGQFEDNNDYELLRGIVEKSILENLTNKSRLHKCAEIYSLIMDWNRTLNILTELTYLLNLVNIDATKLNKTEPERGSDFEVMFKEPMNGICFALAVLSKQRVKLLALLDLKTMRILIDNEQLRYFEEDLVHFLQQVYRIKSDLEVKYRNEYEGFKITNYTKQEGLTKTNQSVFYQEEDDTRDNFPTQIEFGAFRKQRDAFYTILRLWEEKHLNSTWNFSVELGGKIRSLFSIMQHPINMAHLAKLLTNQLIVCCNNCFNFENNLATTELLKSFENVDMTKLNKLEQRFVTPGNFSAELQFPGVQVFFKEFIMASEQNLMFVEQLKMALIGELVNLNDSTYEVFNISNRVNGGEYNEIVMSPEKMSIMRVLAKFAGFIISRPFHYESHQNKIIDSRQIMLRNHYLPQFDVTRLFEVALKDDKLLITIPWLVQYLSMLDCVTLQLDYYQRLLQKLHDLHSNLSQFMNSLSPTSIFILRISLGWLFDQSNISVTFCPEQKISANNSLVNYSDKSIHTLFNPMLEKILTVSCPFLADFRQSVVPLKPTNKLISRTTGRYRHIITTKIPTESNSLKLTTNSVPDNQSKLIEAFLHSQSPSLRKVIDFLIERISSTVIKNFQILHFLEIKKKATQSAKEVTGTDKKVVVLELKSVYMKALGELTKSWNNVVPKMIVDLVSKALDCLIPVETIEPVKVTCQNLVVKMCKAKVNDWRLSHLNQIDVFSKDLHSEAAKKIKSKQNTHSEATEKLYIDMDSPYPSTILIKLQELQHMTSIYVDELREGAILEFLVSYKQCLSVNTFFTTTYKTTIMVLHNVILHLIPKRLELVTDRVLELVIDCFRSECFGELLTPPEPAKILENVKGDEEDVEGMRDQIRNSAPATKYIFSSSVSVVPRCTLFYYAFRPVSCFKVLANYLIRLINAKLLTLDILNEHLVSLLRFDWPTEFLRNISQMTAFISKEFKAASSDPESHLFLDMMSDLTTGIEDFECDS